MSKMLSDKEVEGKISKQREQMERRSAHNWDESPANNWQQLELRKKKAALDSFSLK